MIRPNNDNVLLEVYELKQTNSFMVDSTKDLYKVISVGYDCNDTEEEDIVIVQKVIKLTGAFDELYIASEKDILAYVEEDDAEWN